ncbi:MAG: SMC family ATPase, partial [Acidobacteriota bacterium]
MRPIRLELEGFTSFRKRAEVDFSNLDIFAITGPTGAGKTSLIDALIYALYGRTPRIGEKSVSDLMSQGAQRLSVLLEFRSGGRHYRIARTMRRSGHNVVSKPQLEVLKDDEEWEALAGSVSTVRAQVGRIIGLDFDAFTRSVVLPQGEFDRFLKGSSAERRKILTELLQLDIYLRMGRLARDEAEKARSEATFKKELLASTYAEATEKNRKASQREINQLKRSSGKLEKRLQLVKELQPSAQDLRLARQEAEKAGQEIRSLKRLIEQAQKRRDSSQKALDRSGLEIGQLEKRIEETGYDEKLHFELTRLTPHAQQLAELRRQLEGSRESLEEKDRQHREFEPRLKAALQAKEKAEAKVAQANQEHQQQTARQEKARRRHGSSDAIRQTARRLDDRHQLGQQSDGLEKEVQAL